MEKGAFSSPSGIWAFYARLAQNCAYHNLFEEAILALELAEKANQSLSSSVDWVILSNKIDIYFDCGMLERANAAVPELERLFLRSQHYDQSHQYLILARYHYFQNDFENAENNFHKALTLSKYPAQKKNVLKFYHDFAKTVGKHDLEYYLYQL